MEKNGTTFIYKDLALTTSDAFKLRFNHEWAFNRGAVDENAETDSVIIPMGTAVPVVNNGKDMKVEVAGNYDIYYDADKETITIYEAGTVLGDTWSLIGVNGDWDTDIDMTEVAPGIFVSPVVEITVDGWKLRLNHDWKVNRGCGTLVDNGTFVPAYQDGADIPLSGKFQVVYNANIDVIGTLKWGIAGSIESIPGFSWNNDIPMNLASDGKWYSITPITFAAADVFKIRKDGAWAVNRGGDFAAVDTAFAVAQDGPNITGVEGTYMVVYYPKDEQKNVGNQSGTGCCIQTDPFYRRNIRHQIDDRGYCCSYSDAF